MLFRSHGGSPRATTVRGRAEETRTRGSGSWQNRVVLLCAWRGLKVIVSLPEYDDCIVRIGAGVLDRTGEGLLGAVGPALDSVLVVSDGTAAPDAAARIRGSLADTGVRSRAVDAPAGRSGRTLEVAGELLDAFSQVGLTRRSCVSLDRKSVV